MAERPVVTGFRAFGHVAFNQLVAGSNPARPTKHKSPARKSGAFLFGSSAGLGSLRRFDKTRRVLDAVAKRRRPAGR